MRSETSGRSGLQGYRPICGSQRTITRQLPAVKTSELDQDQPAVSRNLHKNRGETRGDVSIRGLWTRGTDCIIDVRVTDTDAKSNLSKDPARSWKLTKRRKKKKKLPRGLIGKENLAEEAPYWLISGEVVLRCVAMSMLV
jgi:hypothetical protein